MTPIKTGGELLCFVNRCLSFWTFSFGHCVVGSSSIYGFWLPLWYPQALLRPITLYSSIISRKIKKNRQHNWDNENEQNDTKISMKHYTESFDDLKRLNKTKPTTNVSDQLICSPRVINCSLMKGLYSTAHQLVLVSIHRGSHWRNLDWPHSFPLLICPLM